jgi:hypothetical protein
MRCWPFSYCLYLHPCVFIPFHFTSVLFTFSPVVTIFSLYRPVPTSSLQSSYEFYTWACAYAAITVSSLAFPLQFLIHLESISMLTAFGHFRQLHQCLSQIAWPSLFCPWLAPFANFNVDFLITFQSHIGVVLAEDLQRVYVYSNCRL